MQIHFHPRAAVLPNRLWQAMLQRLNPRMTLITTNDKIFELQAGETLLDGLERTRPQVGLPVPQRLLRCLPREIARGQSGLRRAAAGFCRL